MDSVENEVEELVGRLEKVVPYQGKSAVPFMCHEAAALIRQQAATIKERAADLARVTAERDTERTKGDELRKAVAELAGQDTETWPTHGNWSLAIAASYALLKARAENAERERDAAVEREKALREALGQIKALKSQPIGDTGFAVGPLALFQAAQRIARAALANIKEAKTDV